MNMKILLYIPFGIMLTQDPSMKKANQKNKFAIVLGIAQYRNLPSVSSSVHNAEDISTALSEMDFEVHTLLNPKKEDIDQEIRKMAETLNDSSTFLLYFSGHGMYINEENYLLTSDASYLTAKDVQKHACSVRDILTKLNVRARPMASIIVLDACRPLSSPNIRQKKKAGSKENLHITYPMARTFIAYASSSQMPSTDKKDRNSTYTAALLKYLQEPRLSVDEIFRMVTQEVRTETSDMQVPVFVSTMDKDFFFMKKSTR
jgi:uncharacterized caspase-like protein